MERKRTKQIAALIMFVALCVACHLVHNCMVYTTMPEITGMKLSDALKTLEDSKVIENDTLLNQTYLSPVRIIDATTKDNFSLENFDAIETYVVIEQEPKAGDKFKYRPGVFSKNGTTDLATITVINQ